MALLRVLITGIGLSLFNAGLVYAEETEQFTLPPYELKDIGAIASQNLYAVLAKIISETNYRMAGLAGEANHSALARARLAKREEGSYLANSLYDHTGPGLPRWLNWTNWPESFGPWQYKEIFPWNHAYWLVFSQSPVSFLGLSPTIKMYGHYFGADKVSHFFMQGHTYYKFYHFVLNHGGTPEQARHFMLGFGKLIEDTYLGILINGVYSNADLAANYAGWKFYTNLTEPITIGGRIQAPILVLKDHQWQFNGHVRPETLLEPFLSDHLNEAWNPCRYTFTRGRLRSQILKRCPSWIEKNHLTPQLVASQLKETSTWHGEDYGHWLPADSAITLDVCFQAQKVAEKGHL